MYALATLEDRIGGLRGELLAFLKRRVPGHHEEIAQETWLRIARAQPDCPDDRAFRAYTYAVARRLLIDHYRKGATKARFVPLDGGLNLSSGHDPHSTACAAEMLAVVESELRAMKDEVEQVFRWRVTDSLSFKEIALKQGVSINTALGRMHQATRRLSKALENAGIRGET
ncbi:MAG: RNA polymerase sigma factor [Proteobacteria bacterium]|nr:RNA polymerase sigma factor [Pseudomonadota bacterium]